jgi:hypothetical protein
VSGVAVLVEGESDAEAVRALAEQRAVDLADRGVEVVPMGGVTNMARYVAELGPRGRGLRLTGLYDAAEERFVRGGLERGGVAVGPDLARHGFHRCERDLEDELIRALGVPAVLEVVEAAGDRQPWETLTRQPFHRGRSAEVVLRRFMGTTSGRKLRYAGLLVEAGVELDRVPPPLVALLSDVTAAGGGATT